MLAEGKAVAQGKPGEVITEEHLQATYFRVHAKIRWDAEVGDMLVRPIAPVKPAAPPASQTLTSKLRSGTGGG